MARHTSTLCCRPCTSLKTVHELELSQWSANKKYSFGSLLTPNDLILDGPYNKWLRKNLAKFQIVGVGVD